MKKRFLYTMLCITLLLVCLPLAAYAAELDTGTEPAPAPPEVSDLLETEHHNAYISGYETGTFRPNAHISRAETASLFYALLKSKDHPAQSLKDTRGKWYTSAVETLAGLGIISGYTDGTFKPDRAITRAEFVAIAAKFSALESGSLPFRDVPATHWAAPYIASAVKKGWVSGYENGTFKPDKRITRAEAVVIVNRMLGRTPDARIKTLANVKNFYDLYTSHWAYGEIEEASTAHSYQKEGTRETWTDYTKDTSAKSGFVWENGNLYYVSTTTKKFVKGDQTINGTSYKFDANTGAALTGFFTKSGYRRYYKQGKLLEDISGLGLVKGPYFIKVYKNSNYLIIFAKDSAGNYNTPVKAMRVSCGKTTPTGTFYTPARWRWLNMVGNTWAQWCTQIKGNYLFHSVPNYTKNNRDLEVEEYNHLGETRSLGCVRLNCADAKWIYDNCVLKTKVTITTAESSGPLSKPAGITIPSWHTWDPTDPTAQYLCKQKGCH